MSSPCAHTYKKFHFRHKSLHSRKALKGIAQTSEIGAASGVHRDRAAWPTSWRQLAKKLLPGEKVNTTEKDKALKEIQPFCWFSTPNWFTQLNIWPQSILPSNWFTLKLVYLRQKGWAKAGKWEHKSPSSFLLSYTLLYRLIRTGCKQLSWVCSQGMLQMSFSMMKWWSYHDLMGLLCPSMEKPLMSSQLI